MSTPHKPRPQFRHGLAAIVAVAGMGAVLFATCTPIEEAAHLVTATPTQETPTPVEETATPTPTSPSPTPPTPTPTPTPPTATVTPREPKADLVELQAALQDAIDAYGSDGRFAFAVMDLQTGETVGVNAERRQLSGCVMNLFVLYRVALDVQEGRYDVSVVDDLVGATTWSSNAATAYRLYGIAGDGDVAEGVRRVADLIDDLGLDDVVIDHPPAFDGSDDRIGADDNNWLTANDMNRALAALWSGELLDDEWKAWLLDHLENVKPGLNYLTAAVPGEVSHKNGFFQASSGYVDNDAGIIRFEAGGVTYAFAATFLSEEVPYKYGDIVLGQQLMRLAFEAFEARYTAPAQ